MAMTSLYSSFERTVLTLHDMDSEGCLYPSSWDNLSTDLGCILVKSGSTPVGGPVRSGWKWTKGEGRGLDKRLVRLELATIWIQRLRTMSVDPLRRFRSRRGDGDRDRDGQGQE